MFAKFKFFFPIVEISVSKTSTTVEGASALPLMSSSLKESFLVPKVSRLSGALRPVDLPRVAPSNAAKIELKIEQPPVLSETKIKKTRQSDEQSPLPGMNDIITGRYILGVAIFLQILT